MDLSDQVAQFICQGRPSLSYPFSFPIELEGPLVPTDHGLRLDQDQGFFPVGEDFGQENPKPSKRMGRPGLGDLGSLMPLLIAGQLAPQGQDFQVIGREDRK